jgi:hypothetical protein
MPLWSVRSLLLHVVTSDVHYWAVVLLRADDGEEVSPVRTQIEFWISERRMILIQ